MRGARIAVGALALAAGVWWVLAARPEPLRHEEPLVDLMAGFDRTAVERERSDDPVRLERLRLRAHFGVVEGAPRPALLAAPPAVLRFRVRLTEDAVLAFGVGVRGPAGGEAGAPVRFSVAVDGREVWARVVQAGVRRRDRRWFDERVRLAATPARDAEITLRTEGAPSGALPGWTKLRLVREVLRDRQRVTPEAPSVLVLLVDTLRADRLGCYGATPSPSPTLDRLAAGGLVFEQAVAQAPWTLPSIATLLTGLHPRSHGVVGEQPQDTSPRSYLAPTVLTLAELAADAGITTVAITANPLFSPDTNLARGFETFVELGWATGDGDWTRAPEVNGRFLDWLGRNRHLRFLAWLHYMEPHDPYAPPADLAPPTPAGVRPFIARGDVDVMARRVNRGEVPPLPPAEVAHLRALYDAEIRAWDRALAELLAKLDALGARATTRIVVTADHGEEFQEHGKLKHRLQLYEECIRVPLVLAGPGITPGRVAEQAEGIDLLPTVAALLGLGVPPGLPGASLLDPRASRPALVETHHGLAPDGSSTDLVALRTREWKLIRAPALERHELYDLTHDPGERTDRFASAPEGAALAAELAGWTAPPAAPAAGVMSVREKLRALGYLE